MTSQNFEMKGKLLKLIYNVMHMTLQNLEEASRMENVLVARFVAHHTLYFAVYSYVCWTQTPSLYSV